MPSCLVNTFCVIKLFGMTVNWYDIFSIMNKIHKPMQSKDATLESATSQINAGKMQLKKKEKKKDKIDSFLL